MVGAIPQGNGIADIPLCVNDGPATPDAQPRPPMYREPPPPKGWQPRYGAFMKFPVWKNSDNTGYISGYALAINHSNPDAARTEVLEQCQREVLPRERSECSPDKVVILDKAYLRLSMDAPYGLTVQSATQLKELVEQRRSFMMESGPLQPCDASTPAGKCYDSLLALVRNGLHRQPLEKDLHGIAPCPSGPTDAKMKIIGSDGASGTPVPRCGPDRDKRETRLRGGRYDGFAVHPRLTGPPFVSSGHAIAASAEQGALALCTRVFGTGCRSLGANVNGFAATAANDRGELFLGRGPDKASAIADAHRACDTSSGQIVRCDIIALRMAGLPYPQVARLDWHSRTFGAAAAPGGSVSHGGKAWISRGMPSLEEAERYALQHCA